MSHQFVGVDVGGTKVFSVLLDGEGREHGSDRRSSGFGSAEVFQAIAGSIETVLDHGSSLPLGGIGVGIPGQVDSRTGVVSHAVNLGIDSLDLSAGLSKKFGVPVSVLNDVNATALGLTSVHPQADSLVYVNFGTGLAAGIVLDGELWPGSRNLAGELGHLVVDPHGTLCRCGQRGCVETLSSASGISQWLADQGHALESFDDVEGLSPELQSAVVERFMVGFSHALTIVGLTIDPDVVCVGGGTLQVMRRTGHDPLGAAQSNGRAPKFLVDSGFFDSVTYVDNNSSYAARGSLRALTHAS
jgi:glucokinase